MVSIRFLMVALVVGSSGCVDPAEHADADLAQTDLGTRANDGTASSTGWDVADTLHANAPLMDSAASNHRNVHSLWIAGSNMNPVPLTITAHAQDGANVRVAVLGPLVNGTRAVLAADGYASPKHDIDLALDVASRGEHVVVVGSWNLASDTVYDLAARCDNCESRVDVLATPKDGALLDNEQGLVSMLLGDVLVERDTDIEVDVWASPPLRSWDAQLVGTSVASGTQVNALLPATVKPGDDIRLVVREAGGRPLDTGIVTRYAPEQKAFARLDAVLYGDIAAMQIGGVVGYYEGIADLRLRSVTHNREIARDVKHADRPGMVGNGLGAFDASFFPDLSVAATDGEILAVGFINGNGDFSSLGCFEYCNNPSGMSSCTGGPRACPL